MKLVVQLSFCKVSKVLTRVQVITDPMYSLIWSYPVHYYVPQNLADILADNVAPVHSCRQCLEELPCPSMARYFSLCDSPHLRYAYSFHNIQHTIKLYDCKCLCLLYPIVNVCCVTITVKQLLSVDMTYY